MKTKTLFFIALLAVALFAAGCGSANQSSGMGEGNVPANPNRIPYTLAANYFVRNDVPADAVIGKRIDTQEEFNEYFGPAATMDSQPTPIDFANKYVIAVIALPNFRENSLQVRNLTFYRGIVTLAYGQSAGELQSFSTRPTLIVVVDRIYDGEVLVVER